MYIVEKFWVLLLDNYGRKLFSYWLLLFMILNYFCYIIFIIFIFLLQVSLKLFLWSVLLYVDRELGFNLLQVVVFEGKFSMVYKVYGFFGNVVNVMNFEKIGSNVKRFFGKIVVDIFMSLDKKQKGYVYLEEFYKDLVEIYNLLIELYLCSCNDDVEKVVEFVLNEGIDINIFV